MTSLLKRFVAKDGGATAIEYAMIASLISVLIVTAVTTIGTSLSSIFATVSAGL
jgi:pilus assembly protein Flp/PilA